MKLSADDVAWIVEFLSRAVPRGYTEEETLVSLVEKLRRMPVAV